MRLAVLFAPHRGMERSCAILMARHPPARTLVGEEIHMQSSPAAAWTNHGGLLSETVFLHDIKCATLQLLRQIAVYDLSAVGRHQPCVKTLARCSEITPQPF